MYEFNHAADTNIYAVLNMDDIATRYSFASLKISTLPAIICGPAAKQRRGRLLSGTDCVKTMWCPQWPKEAIDWVNRPRVNGWPTADVISKVEQNGCHLVCAQHPSCRNHIHQWRISFSLAEVILLQSWTKTQQIVYHLLRFFAKRELIEKNCPKEEEVLCTYHLKTLMLWTREGTSSEWWNSASVITICSELLKTLREWLMKMQCSNYFIPEANLFKHQLSSKIFEKTVRRLNEFCNPKILCRWFVENYILSFIRKPMENIGLPHFMDYLLLLSKYWKATELNSLDFYFCFTFTHSQNCCRSIIKRGFVLGLRRSLNEVCWARNSEFKVNRTLAYLSAIQNISCFTYHDNLLYILHTAYGLGCGEMSWDSSIFVEFVNAISMQPKIMRSQYHNFPKACAEQCSRFEFLRSQNLMKKLTGSNSRSQFQLLSLMSKQFLAKALKYGDPMSNQTAHAALCYLAALHFATSEYQDARRLCAVVLMDQTSKGDKDSLNAGCLLFIDDVARIVGLAVLHKKITENNRLYFNRRLYFDLRMSPEVFAQYLSTLSAKTIYNHALPDSSYPIDLHLKALMKPMMSSNHCRQIVYRRTYPLTETESSGVSPITVKEIIIDALMKYALENMTSFYNFVLKDFGVSCNTADCYRALYLYKCRQYDKALHLCERILKESDLRNDLKTFSFANVLLSPPFDSFFDRDVQSLLGFHTLFYYLSALRYNMGKIDSSTLQYWFARYKSNAEFQISCFLQHSYSIRCHYFLGKHFLARYLKLRCCIDCELPHSDALDGFVAHKTNLPFEQIIRRFVLLSKQNSRLV